MTTKPTPSSPNLASIVHESEEAAKEATAAVAKANAAQRRAAEAAAKVDAQAVERAREYLAILTSEYPAEHERLITALVESRHALEDAVASGGHVFTEYLNWVRANVAVWALDEALAAARERVGQISGRTPNPPSFNFAIDVANIVDTLAMQAQDDALAAIRERRANFMRGEG